MSNRDRHITARRQSGNDLRSTVPLRFNRSRSDLLNRVIARPGVQRARRPENEYVRSAAECRSNERLEGQIGHSLGEIYIITLRMQI